MFSALNHSVFYEPSAAFETQTQQRFESCACVAFSGLTETWSSSTVDPLLHRATQKSEVNLVTMDISHQGWNFLANKAAF